MLKIGVVVPSWSYFANPFKLQPVYDLFLATLIEENSKDVEVEIIDMRNIRKYNGNITEEYIKEYVPYCDVYFHWIMKTSDYPEVDLIVSTIKKMYPKTYHVAGGTHVDNFENEMQEYFDSIILGPSDNSALNIISDIQSNNLKKVYRDSWKNCPFDSAPIPKREFLPYDSIVNTELFEKYGNILGTSVMFQRGCSFKCSYCVYNVPNIIQARSNENVIKEIEYLKKSYNVKGINIRDEVAIPLAAKKAHSYFDALSKCNIYWRGQTRIGNNETSIVPRDVIKHAAESGCVELAIGVETASEVVMEIIDKTQKITQVGEFIQNCHDFNIKIKMCLILGLPGEPQNIVQVTKNFIENTNPDYANVSGFCPVPGSEIYRNYKEYGIKYIDTNWSKHAHLMYRFDAEESFGLPFEYEKENKWGKTLTRDEIANNIKEVQSYLRNKKMSY